MSSKRSGSVCVTEWSVTPLVRNKELPIASPRERRSLGTLKQTESPRAQLQRLMRARSRRMSSKTMNSPPPHLGSRLSPVLDSLAAMLLPKASLREWRPLELTQTIWLQTKKDLVTPSEDEGCY
jgi:hypothetical protein